MKKKILYISCIIVCTLAIIVGTINLKISDVIPTISENEQNNIIAFIKEIEGMLLSTYEIDITGVTLNDKQKKYITDMYILLNRGKFIEYFNIDNTIKISKYNEIYNYLFGESYKMIGEESIHLNELNISKFYIDKSSILSYKYENEMHVIEIEYTQVFNNEEYKYLVNYYIGAKENKYYLIGFEIK